MGLSEPVLKGIRRKGYRLPTPIQRKAMPLILQGVDVVGMARTGSGKTAAFVIPMLERLKERNPTAMGARAVILSPTRELALQTHKVVKELGRHFDFRTAVLVGGDSMEAQFAELAAAPDVIVATPGRLAHHLTEVSGFSLKSVEYLVFDEADRLFEMGFAEQLNEIMAAMSPSRQTMLFSATMPRMLAEFARAGLRDPELVRLDADMKLSPDLALAFFTVRQDDKPAALLFLLKEVISKGQATIVFAATRHHVEFLSTLLALERIPVAGVHGNMDQSARKINIAKFRAGKASVLVVTDVAARGIDIPLLDNVINYDFPSKPKLFVHRAGRAARAGRSGAAYSMCTRDELAYLLDLHLYLSRPLTPAPVRGIKEAAAAVDVETGVQAASTVFGTFPQAALDDAVEHLRGVMEAAPDLAGLLKAADNAMKLYIRTRPAAAPESARRAKAFAKEGVHALLAAALPSDALGGLEAQDCLADIAAKLRAYRPSQTVFEAEVASARAGQGAGLAATPGVLAAAPYERRIEVMKKKREAHAATIAATARRAGDGNSAGAIVRGAAEPPSTDSGSESDKEGAQAQPTTGKRRGGNNTPAGGDDFLLPRGALDGGSVPIPGSGPSGRYKEDGFYISHVPSGDPTAERFLAVGSGDQIRDAVMDLTAEDAEGAAAQRSAAWHWDVKSKRYVKLQKGEVMKAGKRVKAQGGGVAKGKKAKEAAGQVYEKWAKRTKLSVGGAKVSQRTEQMAAAMDGRFKRGGRGWVNPLKGRGGRDGDEANDGRKGGRDELRSADEVRKQRKLEERKKEHLQKRRQEAKQRERKGGKKSFNGGGGGGRGGGTPGKGGKKGVSAGGRKGPPKSAGKKISKGRAKR